ncbi:MAG: DUF1737 domain-containing protein [Aestuariivirga sp.]
MEKSGNVKAERLRYRILTGPDDKEFCERVSKALEEGYDLYGSPSITFNGKTCVVAQAIVWHGAL